MSDLRAAIRAFDTAVDRWFGELRGNTVADKVFYGASAVGDFSLVWQIAAAGEALQGRERQAVRLAAALGAESLLVNGVVKSFFGRHRPAWEVDRPRKLRRPRSSSFPSGHATSGFMAATLLSEGRPLPVKVGWYGLAAVVAGSRVHVKIHHASDVVGGAVMGVALGALVRRAWE